MLLGGNPVVKTGTLTYFDRSCDPVPVGHVLVLYGDRGSIELKAGMNTNMLMRSRYPSYALISLGTREIQFEQTYSSKDHLFRCNVDIQARVQVCDAKSYVDTFGVESEIGSSFIDHWKRTISMMVYQHGDGGPDKIDGELRLVRDVIDEDKPKRNGVRLIEFNHSMAMDLGMTIAMTLKNEGPRAGARLSALFPEKAALIRQFADDFYRIDREHYQANKDRRDDAEDDYKRYMRVVDDLLSRKIYDTDELRQFVKLDDIRGRLVQTTIGSGAPQGRIEDASGPQPPDP